jgi:hypothetical protein
MDLKHLFQKNEKIKIYEMLIFSTNEKTQHTILD